MNLVSGLTLRAVIPPIAVASVLALAFLAPTPALGSSGAKAVGYANNCGVKGNGYHDHGKPCPNRPFPGKGKGVSEILNGTSPSSQSTTENTAETSEGDDDATTLSVNSTSGSDELTQSTSKANHGKGHGHGKGGG
jgi:hypothetical protein